MLNKDAIQHNNSQKNHLLIGISRPSVRRFIGQILTDFKKHGQSIWQQLFESYDLKNTVWMKDSHALNTTSLAFSTNHNVLCMRYYYETSSMVLYVKYCEL